MCVRKYTINSKLDPWKISLSTVHSHIYMHAYAYAKMHQKYIYVMFVALFVFAVTMTPKFTTINLNRRALNVTWFVTSDELDDVTITVCYRKLGRLQQRLQVIGVNSFWPSGGQNEKLGLAALLESLLRWSCYTSDTSRESLLVWKRISLLWLLWDIQCRKYRDLEIPIKGRSWSLNVVPLDRLVWFPISVL